MIKLLTAVAIVATLTACQTAPAAEPQRVPPNYRALAASLVRVSLKDPYSVRDAQISSPTTLSGMLIGGRKPGVCVILNARNGFGGYTGLQSFSIAFDRGRAIGPFDGSCNNGETWTPFVEVMR